MKIKINNFSKMDLFHFVFTDKKFSDPNVVSIGKKGDFPSLEKWLESRGHDIYNFSKNHMHHDYFSEYSKFIFYDNETPLKKRLEHPLIPGRSKVFVLNKIPSEQDLDLLEDKDDYPIFSGEKMEKFPREVKLEILGNIIKLSKVLYQMIEAGYFELKNITRIDDWIITFQEPILDIFIRYHEYPTSAPDMTTSDEFIINPEFRRNVGIGLMRIISNFIVNNKLVSKKDTTNYESWEDINLWLHLKDKVKIFK